MALQSHNQNEERNRSRHVNAKILHFIAILYVYTEYAFDYFMKWVLLHQAADAVPSHHITL
jgi:hypothetical protein